MLTVFIAFINIVYPASLKKSFNFGILKSFKTRVPAGLRMCHIKIIRKRACYDPIGLVYASILQRRPITPSPFRKTLANKKAERLTQAIDSQKSVNIQKQF